MFVLIDQHDKGLATLPFRKGEPIYLYKNEDDAAQYPLLSQLDTSSPTAFSSEDMAQLIIELERVKSSAEMQRIREIHKAQLLDNIAWLKKGLKHYPHSMWSIDAATRLNDLTAEWGNMEQGVFGYLEDEAITSHTDALIDLAYRCQTGERCLIHTPS